MSRARHERKFDVEPETSVREALERLGLLAEGELTNAAVLLFGSNPQKFFLQAETRCARFKGTEPVEFIDMKVFGGTIIDQREDAVEFVKEHITLHAKIVGTERKEKWEYPRVGNWDKQDYQRMYGPRFARTSLRIGYRKSCGELQEA